ncbi:hypothetical protein G5I_08911 [Acromyrmex echinatior]|uniref:Uncharacterized protein n=1 Tax=Acromyrmex echinatior TaxID=103372 RepID=F4WST4_ACREC|nr:hypothetical protein G5I_08911 [Acromyrmex echinatior]
MHLSHSFTRTYSRSLRSFPTTTRRTTTTLRLRLLRPVTRCSTVEEKEKKEEEEEKEEEAATIPRLHYTTTVSPQTTLQEGEEREMGSTDQNGRTDPIGSVSFARFTCVPFDTSHCIKFENEYTRNCDATNKTVTAMITIELGIRQMRNFNYGALPIGNMKKNGNETRKVLMLSL